MSTKTVVAFIKVCTFAEFWDICAVVPREELNMVARRVVLWKYIVKQGNFYKMSLLISYCSDPIPASFGIAVNEHIADCAAGKASIYMQTDTEEKIPMRLKEYIAWHKAIFSHT